MAHTIAGSNSYHAGILVPDDGDPAVAASVDVSFQMLVDNTTYLNTELSHQSADDRGGTHSLTGPIIWNAGSVAGRFQVNTQVNFSGLIIAAGPIAILSTGGFSNAATSSLRGNVLVGSGPSNTFSVYATTDMFAPLSVHDDVTMGHAVGINDLSVDGSADFDCDVQLTHAGQVATIGGQLAVNEDTSIGGVFRTHQDTHFGVSSTNNHLFTGTVEMQQTLDVDGDCTVNGNLSLNGHANDLGFGAVVGDLSIVGSTTIGNSSSDTLTTNALLTGALQMGANGRVVPSAAFLAPGSGTTALTLSSARELFVSVGSDTVVLSIDDTGMLAGDGFWIYSSVSFGSIRLIVSGTALTTAAKTNSCIMRAIRFPGAAATNWSLWTVTA
jgi:hypothetical protein